MTELRPQVTLTNFLVTVVAIVVLGSVVPGLFAVVP